MRRKFFLNRESDKIVGEKKTWFHSSVLFCEMIHKLKQKRIILTPLCQTGGSKENSETSVENTIGIFDVNVDLVILKIGVQNR